jgi:membrane-bound metal-dependent hydrolase YbcI (DUF457 family)
VNGITHMLTGYFLARAFKKGDGANKYAHDSFPAVFTAIAAILPDIDSSIGIPHAQATHTILGALALAVALTGLAYALGFPFLREVKIPAVQLLAMAAAGVLSHLLLDTFTYYDGPCVGSPAHVYFWPLWGQSFHLDCLFGATPAVYLARVLVEWAFYSPFLVVLVLYRGIKHKENPLAMLCPVSWLRGSSGETFASRSRPVKASLVLLGIACAAIVVLQVAGVILVDFLGLFS